MSTARRDWLAEIESCTTQDRALALKIELDANIAQVTTQIDEARARAAAEGEYADRDWYHRASYAKKRLGRLSQTLQLKIRELKGRREHDVTRYFVDAARRRLQPDVFHDLMTEALDMRALDRPEKARAEST